MSTTTITNPEELERFEYNCGFDSVLIRDGASDAWIGTCTEDGLYCLRPRNENDEVVLIGVDRPSVTVWSAAQNLPLPLTITTEEN